MKQIDKKKIDSMNNKIPPEIKLTAKDDANGFAENIINTVREPLLILDKDLRVVKASRSFYNFFKVSPEETIGNLIYDLGNRQWDIPQLRRLLETILPEKTSFDDYEVKHVFSKIGKRVMLLNARRIERAIGKEKIILLAIEDITERKSEEELLFESSRVTSKYLDILLDRSHVPIIIWNSSFEIVRLNQAFEKLSGYKLNELKNQSLSALFPKEKINSTLEFIKSSVDTDDLDVIEVDILTKNRQIKTVLWNSENIYDESEEKIVATMAQDITRRKLTEQQLRESEERFRNLYRNAKIGLYRTTPSGKILLANNELVKMLGYDSFEQLAERNIEKQGFGPSNTRQEFINKINRDGEIKNFESVWIRLDGTAFFVRENAELIRDSNGNVLYYDGVVEDITVIRKTEIALRESEQNFRTLADSGQALIWAAGTDKLFSYFNKVWLDFTGRTIGQEVDNGWLEGIHPDDIKRFNDVYLNAFDQREKFSVEYRLRRNDGNYRWIQNDGCPRYDSIGEFIGFIGHCLDIEERKNAEEEITMLAHSLKSIKECVSLTDMEDNIIFVNESFLKTYGYNKSELLGKHVSILRSPNNPETLSRDILFATLNGGWSGELLNKRKDGSEFPVYLSTTIVYDKDKKPSGLIGVASDITERNKMIDELRKLSVAVEQSPTSILITDTDGNIEYANPKVSEVTGYRFTDLTGRNPSMFSSGEKTKEEYKHLWNTISSGKEWRGEFHNKKKNGELYWESASISAIKNDRGEITNYLAVKEDITEQKLIEKELIEAKTRAEDADKLKSEFLAQMSHEIRTPLGAIVGNVDYLLESQFEKMDPDTRDCFDGIELASKRIIRTVDLILNAAELQRSIYKPHFIKVNLDLDILEKLIIEYSRSAKQRRLELIYVNELNDTIILADEYSITQIFANLIDNAIKYTNIGKVEIILLKNNSGNIVVEVRDTGIGISKEFLPRLFEPFAQEEQGYSRSFDGNGLGLALVKKYCDINNAVIEVQTEKKAGTIFRVIFDKKVQEELN